MLPPDPPLLTSCTSPASTGNPVLVEDIVSLRTAFSQACPAEQGGYFRQLRDNLDVALAPAIGRPTRRVGEPALAAPAPPLRVDVLDDLVTGDLVVVPDLTVDVGFVVVEVGFVVLFVGVVTVPGLLVPTFGRAVPPLTVPLGTAPLHRPGL